MLGLEVSTPVKCKNNVCCSKKLQPLTLFPRPTTGAVSLGAINGLFVIQCTCDVWKNAGQILR